MAFENIDVGSLRSSINSCRNSINYSSGKQFISSSDSFWQCDAKNNLVNALNVLYDDRFKELERTLDNYSNICNQIEQYKNKQNEINNLNAENNRLSSEVASLEPRRTYTEKVKYTEVEWFKDNDGVWKPKTVEKEKSVTKTDYNVVRQIDEKNNKISDNKLAITGKEREMEQIKTNIDIYL